MPDVQFLLRQPFLWWMERAGGQYSSISTGEKESLGNPPNRHGASRLHSYNPWILAHAEGEERFRAALYWLRYLDYFHWPGVLFFSSLPTLLQGLVQQDLPLASKTLRAFASRQRQVAAGF